MNLKRLLAVVTVCLTLGTLAATPAVATPIITLTSGDVSVSVTDNGIGDANLALGAVTFVGSVGLWTVNVTTGLSYPAIGSPSLPELDLNSVNVSTSAAGTLVMSLTDTGFDYTGRLLMQIGGTIATGGVLLYTGYWDTNPIGSLVFGPGAFSGAADAAGSPGSLTQTVTLTHTAAGASSFNATLAQVPEPTSLMLLGIGLIGLTRLRRRG